MLQGSTRFWWCQRTWQITHVTCQSLINKCPETSIYRRKQQPDSEGTKQTVRWWIKSKVAIKSKSTRHAFSIDGFSLHFVSLLLFHVGVAVWHHPPPPTPSPKCEKVKPVYSSSDKWCHSDCTSHHHQAARFLAVSTQDDSLTWSVSPSPRLIPGPIWLEAQPFN